MDEPSTFRYIDHQPKPHPLMYGWVNVLLQVEERESGDVIYLKTPLDNCSDGEEEESEVGGANNSEEIGDMIIVLDKVG